MPLDPSLFLQGAALQQRDREMMLNNLQKGIENNLALKKIKSDEATKGFDLEKLAQGYQIKKNLKVPTTPEEQAAFDTYVQFQSSEMAQNPTTGDLYPKFQWGGSSPSPQGFDTGMFAPGPLGQGTNEAMRLPYDQIKPLDMAGIEGMLPPDDGGTSGVVPGAPGLNTEMFGSQIQMPNLPVNNPKTLQKAAEATIQGNIDLQKDIVGKQADSQIKKQEGQPKAEARLSDAAMTLDSMDKTIEDAILMVGPETAGLGSNLKDIPLVGKGTKAYDLSALLNTIKADAAFSEIQKMRDNSPTGGALGNTTEKELDLLSAAKANVDQAQSPEQLKKALRNYRSVRKKSLESVSAAFEKEYGYRPDFAKQGETKRRKYNPATGRLE